jgi:hypothetical protein
MKEKTSQIKQQMHALDSIEERLELLNGAYEDDVAYLVTCGPSLTKHDQKVLKSKLKDKLVICAKQSFNYLSDICDFHLISTYNFQPYTYDNEHTASVGRGPSYTELKNTIDCTTAMYDWFVQEEIDVEILSDTNPADERFKRITINEI